MTLLSTKQNEPYLQTEGVNFDVLHKFDFIEAEKVRSNDIQAISKKFGVILYLFRLRQPAMSLSVRSSISSKLMVYRSTIVISTSLVITSLLEEISKP